MRSPVSRARASPSSVSTVAGGSSSHSPSARRRSIETLRIEAAKHRLGHVESEEHARRLLIDPRAGAGAGLDDCLRREVARADVLGERARDQILDGLIEHVLILALRAAALPLPA